MAQRRKPLLEARRGKVSALYLCLDPRSDVQRCDVGDRRHAFHFLPCQKFPHGAAVGTARVRIEDVSGEEFEEAHARLVAGNEGRSRRQECKLIHFLSPAKRIGPKCANCRIGSV